MDKEASYMSNPIGGAHNRRERLFIKNIGLCKIER